MEHIALTLNLCFIKISLQPTYQSILVLRVVPPKYFVSLIYSVECFPESLMGSPATWENCDDHLMSNVFVMLFNHKLIDRLFFYLKKTIIAFLVKIFHFINMNCFVPTYSLSCWAFVEDKTFNNNTEFRNISFVFCKKVTSWRTMPAKKI